MENETNRERLAQETIFVTAEDHCYEVSSIGSTTKEELGSTQEESDTRVLLHAAYAAKAGYRAVVITSEDTDVLVLSLAFKGFIPCPMFVMRSTQSNKIHRCVDSWAQNCAGRCLVSTPLLSVTVSALSRKRAK